MSILGIFLTCFALGALPFAWLHERKYEVKDETYQETNYCNSFNKQFKKPDYSFNEDGNSFTVGVV